MSRRNSDGSIPITKGKYIDISRIPKQVSILEVKQYRGYSERINTLLIALYRLPNTREYSSTRRSIRAVIKNYRSHLDYVATFKKFWLYKGMVFTVNKGNTIKMSNTISDRRHDMYNQNSSTRKQKGKISYWYTRNGAFRFEIGGIEDSTVPVNTLNHIAIEIEMITFDKDKLTAELYDNPNGKYVQLKRDGSLRTDGDKGQPVEMVICCPQHKYREVVSDILTLTNKVGGYVNRSCGLHVHLDMRNRDVRQSYKNLVSKQKLLQTLVPKDRTTNTYCRPNKSKDFDKETKIGGSHASRYKIVNPESYGKYKTLEVRLHHGTLHAGKIINWVSLLLGIATDAKADESFFYKKIIAMKKSNAEKFTIEQEHLAYEEVV